MSRRDRTAYADMGSRPVSLDGAVAISQPVAGFYRGKLRSGSIVGGIRIWFGAPLDPVTGEELDRSHRWQAEFDGEPVDFDAVWPKCAGSPISERDYREFVGRREWARKNAPGSAYAKIGHRYDPLADENPMPF